MKRRVNDRILGTISDLTRSKRRSRAMMTSSVCFTVSLVTYGVALLISQIPTCNAGVVDRDISRAMWCLGLRDWRSSHAWNILFWPAIDKTLSNLSIKYGGCLGSKDSRLGTRTKSRSCSCRGFVMGAAAYSLAITSRTCCPFFLQ